MGAHTFDRSMTGLDHDILFEVFTCIEPSDLVRCRRVRCYLSRQADAHEDTMHRSVDAFAK